MKHYIRLYHETPKGNAGNAVENWVENHHEWTDDPEEHSYDEIEDLEGNTYTHGNWRFTQDDSPQGLLDDLEQRLSQIQGGLWYKIGYHACDHDEDENIPCVWDDGRDSEPDISVPSHVPDL